MALQIINTVILATGLVGIVITVIQYRKDKKNPDLNKKTFYWDFFINQYLDAKFKTDTGKKIELKEGRLCLENKYKNNEGKYEEIACLSIKTNPPTFENKLAHRLSVILNRIGQAAFLGDLPLEYVFPISSKMILNDWDLAKTLIDEKISNINDDYNAIKYNRKFARWIACASCMYLVAYHAEKVTDADIHIKKYTHQFVICERSEKIATYFKEGKYKTVANEIIKEIESLQESDKKIVAKSVFDYIKELKDVFIKKMSSY